MKFRKKYFRFFYFDFFSVDFFTKNYAKISNLNPKNPRKKLEIFKNLKNLRFFSKNPTSEKSRQKIPNYSTTCIARFNLVWAGRGPRWTSTAYLIALGKSSF